MIDDLTQKYAELKFRIASMDLEEEKKSFDVCVNRLKVHKSLPVGKASLIQLKLMVRVQKLLCKFFKRNCAAYLSVYVLQIPVITKSL